MPAAHILMTTTVGPMTLELDADNAPKTVENFLSYVSKRLLRRYDFSPGHQQLHGAGWWFHG